MREPAMTTERRGFRSAANQLVWPCLPATIPLTARVARELYCQVRAFAPLNRSHVGA
jgi:hypothetical protein